MPKGGYRPGAGRPKEVDEATVLRGLVGWAAEVQGGIPPMEEPREEIAGVVRKALKPLDYMLAVMNDPAVDPNRRDRMAIAAAPFMHSRKGERGKREGVADAAEEAATGKFLPPPAPGKSLN